MKIKLFFLTLILFISASCSNNAETTNYNCPTPYSNSLVVSSTHLCVEYAITPEEKNKGLGERISMPQNAGMVFIFKNNGGERPGFWMKDMKIDLDFLWIKNNQVVEITKNVLAPKTSEENLDTNLEIFYPKQNIDSVLEVNSGWAEKNNIKVGDTMSQKNNPR